MKERKPFEIPDSVLNQLNECTLSFCLSYIDQNGNPCIITRSDNKSFFLSMITNIELWIQAHKACMVDMNVQEMTMPVEEDED